MTERLTTLAIVKDWLGIDTEDSDPQLVRIIDAASQFALNYMNRDGFAVQTYTDNFRGNGKCQTLLRNWPVRSVSSVGISGQLIVASTLGQGGMPSCGYTISDPRQAPQQIELWGYNFYYRAPCQVIYTAGYEMSQTYTLETTVFDKPILITPAGGGQWVGDVGVTLDGVPATRVASNNPATGEYYVDEWGTYAFSPDDNGKVAVITYSYCPPDVSLGVTEMIGEWFKRKDRIGVLSKSLSGGVGESVTFGNNEMNDAVRAYLQPYVNVAIL